MKFWKITSSTLIALVMLACGVHADIVVTPWLPIFKGVDRAVGTNFPSTYYENNGVFYTDSTLQVANCVRVDLLDPDVQFFTTPRVTNYVADSNETPSTTVSNFLKRHSVQVATVANFYETFYLGQWNTSPPVDGLPTRIFGLSVCTGEVVNASDFGPDSNGRYASLLFTTNKVPYLALNNFPPGTNTAGIYTAVTGYYPVLTNGVIIGSSALIAAYPDFGFHGSQPQPRTLFGLSADRRYLYLLIIDGRQAYSQGADDNDMGFWLLQFGASDGIAMDGGGSTAMYMEDCGGGNPKPLGHSSFIGTTGPSRERITGSHFGVRALPLPAFINNVAAAPASQAATVTWTTISNATSQVEYGITPSLGTFSPFSAVLKTNHSVTLSGLAPGTRHYFRALSAAGGITNSVTCAVLSFVTTNFAGGSLVPLTQTWKWQTANLNGESWEGVDYDDSSWLSGPACLWADQRNPVPSQYTNFVPNFAAGTRMPIDPFTDYPYPTYYFRTSFIYSNSLNGLTLIFSNYLDDGAVFYLNGYEIFRTNMPPGDVSNETTTPVNCPCILSGFNNSATCPMLFSLTGSSLSNLVFGNNIYAVELHNYRPGNPSIDVAFESAVHFSLPPPMIPPPFITNVVIVPGENGAAFTWTTISNSTSQVLFGATPSLGSSNSLDSNLVSNHVMALTGLKPATEYYFRIVSSIGSNQFAHDGTFTTTSFLSPLVTSSNFWRFQTVNLTGTNWAAPAYDDSGWPGQGSALLYIEDSVDVSPRNTLLPGSGSLFPTYYFRTHFNFSGTTAGFALLVTNFIDDGAVLYLNGREIQRVRMNPGPVGYSAVANGCPLNLCDATIDVPDVFRLSGDAMTNLVEGNNVLAAEVHQFTVSQNDIVFGSTVALVRALVSETSLRISRSNNIVCVSWNGPGFTLQRANVLTGTNVWSDVPGPITSSPYCTSNPATSTFFRLRE